MIATITRHQLTAFSRQRTLGVLLACLVTVTVLAGFIGWSSQNTITRVYDAAVTLLASRGQGAPPDPFTLKPTLSLLTNMTIYIPLVGALLALVVGHLAVAEDRGNGVGRLIFTRPVGRTTYIGAKLLAVGTVVAAGLAASLLVSALALLIVNRSVLGVADSGRLLGFYAVSWLYLMIFALIGMAGVLLTRHRSVALLAALATWLGVTFVVPQFTSGLRPTASLNPLSEPVGTSQAFFAFTARARPFSLSEQYKALSGQILEVGPGGAVSDAATRLAPLLLAGVVLVVVVFAAVRTVDYSRSVGNE